MWQRRARLLLAMTIAAVALACGASRTAEGPTPTAAPTTESALPVPSQTPDAAAPNAATRAASPAPQPERVDIRASRLVIPSLNIDSPVQPSYVIPDNSPPAPGCPPSPPGRETFTVPNYGIATPVDTFEGLENKAWIFGHSKWLGEPGVFFSLQELVPGDEVLVDGVDRRTGEQIKRRRFVVRGLYLTDIDSGGKLVTAQSAAEIPAKPMVILQTSVREDGANRPWILNQQQVMAKSQNLVEGDINDPCKYLLLFILAHAS